MCLLSCSISFYWGVIGSFGENESVIKGGHRISGGSTEDPMINNRRSLSITGPFFLSSHYNSNHMSQIWYKGESINRLQIYTVLLDMQLNTYFRKSGFLEQSSKYMTMSCHLHTGKNHEKIYGKFLPILWKNWDILRKIQHFPMIFPVHTKGRGGNTQICLGNVLLHLRKCQLDQYA